jgi:uncharacterized protein
MQVSRREALRHLLSAGIGATAGVTAHGHLYERHALRLERVDLTVHGLPPAHDGLRVGFITDLHHSEFVPQTTIARAVDLVTAQRPDLVVLGGDYVTNFDVRFAEPCAEALEALEAPLGVIAVLGNHDDEKEVPAALRRRKFTVLKDARTTLRVRGEPLDIVGIRFWTRQPGEIAALVNWSAASRLLVAHDPRRLQQAADLRMQVVLSGHTHGGQVVLPGMGAIAARRFPVVAGVARQGDTSLFVSRGVGTVVLPIRINCPPEVAVLTLRRADASGAE